MRLVALDPGQTTGVAYYIGDQYADQWEFGQLGPKPHHNALFLHLQQFEPHVVVIEDFVHVGRESVMLTPVEYIGVARLYTQKYDIPMVKQTPGGPKKFWKVEKLRKLNLYVPGQKHAMDALRHALYYLAFTQKEEKWLAQLKS